MFIVILKIQFQTCLERQFNIFSFYLNSRFRNTYICPQLYLTPVSRIYVCTLRKICKIVYIHQNLCEQSLLHYRLRKSKKICREDVSQPTFEQIQPRFIFPYGTIDITFTKPFTSQNNILQQFWNLVPDLFPLWLCCLNLSNRCYFIRDIESKMSNSSITQGLFQRYPFHGSSVQLQNSS